MQTRQVGFPAGRRTRLALTALASCALVFPLAPSVGVAAPAPEGETPGVFTAADQSGPSDIPPGTPALTLVTGDQVVLEIPPGSTQPVPRVRLAPREDGSRPGYTVTQASADDVYVVPADAEPLVATGRLDRELFNVGRLAKEGYPGDAAALPVIVQFDRSVRAASAASQARKLSGLVPTNDLASINAVGAELSPAQATALWHDLVDPAATTVQPGGTVGPRLAAPVAGVWLDREVQASLDRTAQAIGAPAAHAAGFTGAGVKVAVLDSGIDATHPDFAGRIAATQNFTAEESAVDRNGHGTHVASILAGSGAASGGRFTGVAPGASLLIGKVLDSNGLGTFSGIVDGMEWAVEQGADVVNMSLGTQGPSSGQDPLTQAVDQLTAATGTLFVVAAGNLGTGGAGAFQIAGPGTAEAALTVAATDGPPAFPADWLSKAGFSSAGPVLSSHILKPDIAAPGVSVAAARAAGTSRGTVVDESYTRLSGTSMATPHVAGAAALLAQRFPDWQADRLKPALMSTSANTQSPRPVYAVGAGRVDAARATSQQVFATTVNLDYGLSEDREAGPVTRTVTYTNPGAEPVTLDLTGLFQRATAFGAEPQPVPDGVLTLGASQVTVPAGGTAEVPVTLVRASSTTADGFYSGAVLATSTGGARVSVPVAFSKQTSGSRLIVRIVGHDGQALPSDADLFLRRVDRGGFRFLRYFAGAEARVRLDPGTYSLSAGGVNVVGPDGEQRREMLIAPEVDLTQDAEVVLDLRNTRPTRVRTPDPSQALEISTGYLRTDVRGAESGQFIIDRYPVIEHRVNPTAAPVTKGALSFFHNQWRGTPPVSATATGGRTHLTLDPRYASYLDFSDQNAPVAKFDGRVRRDLVSIGAGTPEELASVDVRGKLVLLKVPAETTFQELFDRLAAARAANAAGALLTVTGFRPGLLIFSGIGYPLPTMSLPPGQVDELLTLLGRTRVTVDLASAPVATYAYRLRFTSEGVFPDPDYALHRDQLATLDEHLHSEQAGFASLNWWRDNPIFTPPLIYPAQRRLTVFLRAGGDESWVRQTLLPGQEDRSVWRSVDTFTEPRRFVSHTGMMPSSPGVPLGQGGSECGMCREGDWLFPHMVWTNSNKNEFSYLLAPTEHIDCCGPFQIRLFRDGQEIPLGTPHPQFGGRAAFQVPADPGVYRLTYQTQSSPSSGAAGREVHAEWTFRSQRPTQPCPANGAADGYIMCPVRALTGADIGPGGFEQILFLRHDLGLDLENRARAGREQPITITAYHQPTSDRPAPAIAGLKLWVSFDRGATWRAVDVDRVHGGQFRAELDHPALSRTNGAVSLRGEAWDTAGNRILLTTLDAYRLR